MAGYNLRIWRAMPGDGRVAVYKAWKRPLH